MSFMALRVRVILAFLVSFSVHLGLPKEEAGPCLTGWIPFQGSCFFFSNETASWPTARTRCRLHGADLITISSDFENAFVTSHFSSLQCLAERTWLGLHRDPTNISRWIWLDNNDTGSINYTKWHGKEPLNLTLDKSCAESQPTDSVYWHGRECTARACYICQKDAKECSVEGVCSGQPCLDTAGGYRCLCGEGFQETEENSVCKDIDECDSSNGGCPHNCINTLGSFVCQCRDGYITEENGHICKPILIKHTTDISTSRVAESGTTNNETTSGPFEQDNSPQETEENSDSSGNGIADTQEESPSASFGVLLTMAIPLCFIVCFLILCYLKGPGKDKSKDTIGSSTGRLVECSSAFADTAFMDGASNTAKGIKMTNKEVKNGRHPETEPMV